MAYDILFPYLGGKNFHLRQILPHLPYTPVFVDVFGGSGAVIYNKRPLSPLSVYNDGWQVLYLFFRTIKYHGRRLLWALQFTPHSRETFEQARYILKNYASLSVAEWEVAWSLWVVIHSGFGRRIYGGSFQAPFRECPENWSRWLEWFRHAPIRIQRAVSFFQNVHLENLDFRQAFEKYDSPQTLLYCDPPYWCQHSTPSRTKRYFFLPFTQQDHFDLLNLCRKAKGFVCLSGYDTPVYRKHLTGWNVQTWKRFLSIHNQETRHRKKNVTEALFCNYQWNAQKLTWERIAE